MESLQLQRGAKTFGGVRALAGVSVEFGRPGVVAIVGPNGAGKTTLLNVLTGLCCLDEGRVLLGATDITKCGLAQIARLGVVRTFQCPRVVARESVIAHVEMACSPASDETLYAALYGVRDERSGRDARDTATASLEAVGLGNKADALAGTLSFGERKLLSMAMCLGAGARFLLLDEAVGGVAPPLVDRILQVVREFASCSRVVVLVEHDLNVVRAIADRVVVMEHGAIIADGVPEEVLQRPEVLEAYVG